MSKGGPLSTTEKYAIQGMLAEGKSVEEVEQQLGREGGKAVRNYISGELDSILDTVVNARLQRVASGDASADIPPNEPREEAALDAERSETGNKVISSRDLINRRLAEERGDIPEEEQITVSPDIKRQTLQLLRGAGLNQKEAEQIFDRSEQRLVRQPSTAEQMYTFCLRNISALDHMITQAQGGQEGVAVMTGAASALAEERRKKTARSQRSSRTARGKVFEPKQGRMRKG